jgi:hypothetical protein
MCMGLRKSPPELNAAAVILKSPTNSVAAAASTLINQKNYVAAILVGSGVRTNHYDVLEVDASASTNSEDLEEYECNANSSKEDDMSFHLEKNGSDAASGAEDYKLVAPEGLVYSDDEAYLFEVESEDETRTSFPKDVVSKKLILCGPTKPDVRNMTKATAEIVLKAYAKERKAYPDKQRFARVKAVTSVSHLSGYSGHNCMQLRTMTDVFIPCAAIAHMGFTG